MEKEKETPTKETWAEEEVKLYINNNSCDPYEDGFDEYVNNCAKSALKAYNCLLEDGHSGMSIGVTKNILNRLIDRKPLTPLEDGEDQWKFAYETEDGIKKYSHVRMSSLDKHVYPDGTIKFIDYNRYYATDIDTFASYTNGEVCDILNEMFPIRMPYYPNINPYVVHTETFLVNPANGDYDTRGILYITTPTGVRVNVNRFFTEKDEIMVEIDKEEYDKLKEKAKKE